VKQLTKIGLSMGWILGYVSRWISPGPTSRDRLWQTMGAHS